jgi:low affinity Fe/Cu permease
LQKCQALLLVQLSKARQDLISLCEKKTQMVQVLSSVSSTIAELARQEQSFDRMHEQADQIVKQMNFSAYTDPVGHEESEYNHITVLLSYTAQKIVHVSERIVKHETHWRSVQDGRNAALVHYALV